MFNCEIIIVQGILGCQTHCKENIQKIQVKEFWPDRGKQQKFWLNDATRPLKLLRNKSIYYESFFNSCKQHPI